MPSKPFPLRRLCLAAIAVVSLLQGGAHPRQQLPPIVFVQRERVPGSLLVPGVGPGGRTLATGGKLVVRDADGSFHPLLPGRFFDVSSPAVSYDGRSIAFAAVTSRDSMWRLWRCDLYGRQLAPITRSDRAAEVQAYAQAAGGQVSAQAASGPGLAQAAGGQVSAQAASGRLARYDDLDPCWLPDGRIVFASTRWPWLAQKGGKPATNLWIVDADGTGMQRLTSERNGAEKPSIDPVTGRIVYARWFFNRYLARDGEPSVTTDRADAAPADTVDLWQAVSIDLDGDHLRLQGGDPLTRMGQMAYRPVVQQDTTLIGVCAERGSLMGATRLGVQAFARGFAQARPLAGYGSPFGWSAGMPATLPDGSIVFCMDEGGTGNWDLYRTTPAGVEPLPVALEPNTLELDPAVLAPRPLPPVLRATREQSLPALPPSTLADLQTGKRSARFDCLNVYANGPIDGRWLAAVPPQRDARIRFWAALARPGVEWGDTLVMVREAEVTPQGQVHVDAVPSDVPMFEQLLDAHGHVLRSGSGPAHVPGFNFTRPGAGTQCVGCHAGHSALPVADSHSGGEWTNLAPAAHVTASTMHRDLADAQGAVDRLTMGDPARTAWIADSLRGQWLRLAWDTPVELQRVAVYPWRGGAADHGGIKVQRCEVVFSLQGREVKRVLLDKELLPRGTSIALGVLKVDALEVRPLLTNGRYRDRSLAGLAEVEAIGRMAWE
jgi:hypothetical protein